MIKKLLIRLGIIRPPIVALDPMSGILASSLAATKAYNAGLTMSPGPPKFFINGNVRLPAHTPADHLQ
jgi:hypothetical protein